MSQYRKRPVVISAWQNFTGDKETDGKPGLAAPCPAWLDAALDDGRVRGGPRGSLLIQTLEGEMRADVGDWIIQGVKGELYPCKPDIFAATYEAVDPTGD